MSVSDWIRKNPIAFFISKKEKVKTKQKMININANLVAEPTFSSFENDNEKVEVVNFTLVKKYGKGKEYTNCCAYGEKRRLPKVLKRVISSMSLAISKNEKKMERHIKTSS